MNLFNHLAAGKTITGLICMLALVLSPAVRADDVAHADMDKTLRVSFNAADSGLDLPQSQSSAYSNMIVGMIAEPLLRYDFFSEKSVIVPNTATALPEVSPDGLTYTFHIQKGIYFADDPAFRGKRRELTAQDYVYTFLRLNDPVFRAPEAADFEGKIAGLDAARKMALKKGKMDFDTPVEGVLAPDRYTLQFRLTRPAPEFINEFTSPSIGAIAREVVEFYGNQISSHPVGTGPYRLESYVPQSKIILSANPHYRGLPWQANGDFARNHVDLVREMQGKILPRIGRIDISLITESQTEWLTFSSGRLDMLAVPPNAIPNVLDAKNQLLPTWTKAGVRLYRSVEPAYTYETFNLRDPVIGGYTPEKIALRRAISLGYNLSREIATIRHNQAVKAESMVVPGSVSFDPAYRGNVAYDPALANKLLDRFKYKRGTDGYRNLPDGKPLTLVKAGLADSTSLALNEIFKKSMDDIGIRTEFTAGNFSDYLKQAGACKLMMFGLANLATTPDALDAFTTLQSSAIGSGNLSCYASRHFDTLYQQAAVLANGAEKNALITRMVKQIEADTPILLHTNRIKNVLTRPHVQGYLPRPFVNPLWLYLDLSKPGNT